MSLKIPMKNGRRPGPISTKPQSEIDDLRKKESLELARNNERSKAMWDKWADARWKVPQIKRRYVIDKRGVIRRAGD